ncbi:LPXTG cell wall anchor domain-containing protein [Clavibacter sp.]|nr:LPXTG cell wall anchor domain-containing protein [Clavibacter sp.]MBD5380949.1 LPXTG cell wall anchor domain-containing protein [Clavibacter sp.]
MLGQVLLALVGLGILALSLPDATGDAPSAWWGVVGGALIVVGAIAAVVRGRRRRGSASGARR